MATVGLITSILEATSAIDSGRKGFATRGKEQEGRISYETGIAIAMTSFLEAKATADPETIIRAEYAFITQELQFCGEGDRDARNSLTKAVEGFQDAFLCLRAVEDAAGYREVADRTYPRDPKYRVQGFPKDAFHIVCAAHSTRIKNILRSPGIDAIEKKLLERRFANLSVAKNAYIEKQVKALTV